ncbi:thiamine pyrophosphate-binding protein [Nitratireductor kimnyeongensis]|nr:thiamine pyrophosphate-binding protein [Nitratireductor kimnyeongensis]
MPACETPLESANDGRFGSDVVAETLRALDIPYIALVPGSSYRGLHDSMVNHLGNTNPQMLVCLHEDAAVAIAHGYAKVTGKAMGAALHSNVGLLHGAMSIFDTWCDRMPMLIIGATGPLDAATRRPWIDWLHTSRDQGAVIRQFTKWDDVPYSPAAAREALVRAKWVSETVPKGPTYVSLDVDMQEKPLTGQVPQTAVGRLMPRPDTAGSKEAVETACQMLQNARKPVILMGRFDREQAGWDERVALAEMLGATVITDLKLGAAFPTEHPLHVGPPGTRLAPAAKEAVKAADVVLSLDWVDLGGALKQAGLGDHPEPRIIHVSRDHTIHNGWSMDHQMLPVADLFISADPAKVVPQLLEALGLNRKPYERREALPLPQATENADEFTIHDLALELRRAMADRSVSIACLPLSWNGNFWPFRDPLDYLGFNGGAGVGGGPGIAVGAALALKGSGRLPLAICGDGDFLMGHTALWTAVHYKLPLLMIVANNRCYFNDVKHQEQMAVTRGREVENKWIGQRLTEPDVDIAALGAAQGASAFGPVSKGDDLFAVFEKAIAEVEAGGVAVVDVRIASGYAGQ